MPDLKKALKKIYKTIPFKRRLFSLLKKVWSPPESIYQHLYFNGLIEVSINDTRHFKIMHYGYRLEYEFFWKGLYGSWEKHSIKLWVTLLKDSKVVFDIGANTGIYSLIAKTANPELEVHAFEPFDAIYKKLVRNVALNSFEIHSNCKAISNYTGDAVIYTEDRDFAYSVTVNKNLWVKNKEPIKLNIKTITLKDYIEQNKITGINLMKIDVETHEPEVMEGFVPYLKQFKPIILIEILNDEVAKKLNNYFDPADYIFYNIDERDGIRKTVSLSRSNSYNYLIVPREKEYLLNK
ncbi:MAG: FkbM family methyltransferase [Ginsengibacter sp.]